MSLTIVGLGPGPKEDLTLRAQRAIQQADRLLVQTERHPLYAYLCEQNTRTEAMDDLYEQADDRLGNKHFWGSKPTVGMNIRKIHTGLPSMIIDTLADVATDDLDKIDVDILYMDPPYNERQYAPNYHILETVAKYDNPEISGVTGIRDYKTQKSRFCNSKTALEDLDTVAKIAKFKYLVLSYNSEGIMPQEKIIETLEKYGKVSLEQFEYARFKSNNNGLAKSRKTVFEQLYILEK